MQCSNKKLSLCKRLQYSVLYNEKLDWLKREKEWKWDKIDWIVNAILLIIFLLPNWLGAKYVVLFMLTMGIASVLGAIRHIKTMPGDIESKLMGGGMCMSMIFIIGVLAIFFTGLFLRYI
jgi:hypothetical protein